MIVEEEVVVEVDHVAEVVVEPHAVGEEEVHMVHGHRWPVQSAPSVTVQWAVMVEERRNLVLMILVLDLAGVRNRPVEEEVAECIAIHSRRRRRIMQRLLLLLVIMAVHQEVTEAVEVGN